MTLTTMARFIPLSIVGALAGLIGGYIPATVALNLMVDPGAPFPASVQTADGVTKIVWSASAGGIMAAFQRATGRGALPRWWPLACAAAWAAAIVLASPARGTESNDLRLALPAALLFSLVGGGVLLARRRVIAPPERPEIRAIARRSRSDGYRIGALAIPAYLIFVGIGHTVLAQVMSAQATGPRDGQAFSGTFVLGLTLVVTGAFALAVARESGTAAIVRSIAIGILVAAAVVAYTASRGYDLGGVAGQPQCIVEQGRQVCMPGDGTYIKDARPDLVVLLLAGVGAYAFAHLLGRRMTVPPAALAPHS